MKPQKVKLITINQYPTEKPYIVIGDLFRSMKDDNISQSNQNYFNKKVLNHWQPIKLAIVSLDTGIEIILDHDAILGCQFKYEMLDRVVDESGAIHTKFKTSPFDVDLCDLILKINEGICWLDGSKHIIYLQPTMEKKNESVQTIKSKKIKIENNE